MILHTLVIEPNDSLQGLLAREPVLPTALAVQIALQLARQVRRLHVEQGCIQRSVGVAAVSFDEEQQACLGEVPPPVRFGGERSDPDLCPPELQGRETVALPATIGDAQDVLRQAGIDMDARRIDVYQLGAVLCRLATGASVASFLRSPRAASHLSAELKAILEHALGYDPTHRYDTVDGVIADAERCLSGLLAEAAPESAADSKSSAGETGVDTSPSIGPGGQPDTSPTLPPAAFSRAADVLPFQRLGHYEIVGRIGHGGMGDVYRGYEEKLGRTVAIKVLPAELARQEDFVRRFYQEASAAAKLIHPNVVQIYFIGEESGHHYFAMQYVEGETLAALLARRQRLGVDEALVVLDEATSGLAAAHRRGLVHRDIKPGNLLIDAENRRVLLADFGLVKSVAESGKFTATGVVMGTVDYISPEQGRGHPVDARSDLYSLGVLAYQILAGCLPFTADSPTAMIFQHVYEQPRPLREVAPHVPPALAAIVEKLLAKSPDARHQTAEDLLADLRAFGAGRPLPSFAKAVPAQIVTDVEVVSAGPRTAVIQAPRLEGPPSVPPHLLQAPRTSWWVRTCDRMLGRLQVVAPKVAARVQKTEQLVRGAVAEYEQRRDRLQALVTEGEAVLQELTAQRDANREAAREAALAAEAEADPQGKQEVLDRREACEQAVQQLEAPLREQHEQLEDMRVKLAQVNATLGNLRAQRDVLNARLKLAQARVQQAGGKPARRKRLAFIVAALGLLCLPVLVAAVSYGVRRFWQAGEAVIADIQSASASTYTEAMLNRGYDPVSRRPNAGTTPPSDETDVGPAAIPLRQLIGHQGTVHGVAFHPEGTLLASAGFDYTLRVWEPSTGRQIRQLSGESLEAFSTAVFSPDGRLLAGGMANTFNDSPALKVWDVSTAEMEREMIDGGAVAALAFRPGTPQIVALTAERANTYSLGLWDTESGKQMARIQTGDLTIGPTMGTNPIAVSPDGRLVAFPVTGPTGQAVALWDLEASAVVKSLDTGALWQVSVAFSPDGGVLLAAGSMTYTWSFGSHRFGQAQAWSVTDGQRIGTFNSAQDGIVHAVSFSPDGTKLAVAGGNAVRIWAVRQARIVQILQGHEAYSVAFSYDGQMLVSGGEASGHQPRPSGIAPDEPNLLLWRIKP